MIVIFEEVPGRNRHNMVKTLTMKDFEVVMIQTCVFGAKENKMRGGVADVVRGIRTGPARSDIIESESGLIEDPSNHVDFTVGRFADDLCQGIHVCSDFLLQIHWLRPGAYLDAFRSVSRQVRCFDDRDASRHRYRVGQIKRRGAVTRRCECNLVERDVNDQWLSRAQLQSVEVAVW